MKAKLSAQTIINWLLLVLLLVTAISYYQISKKLNTIKELRYSIIKDNDTQSSLSIALTGLFNDYEGSIENYKNHSSPQNHDQLIAQSKKLDDALNQASFIYGLNVKQSIDLFHAWQYRFQTNLRQNKEKNKKNTIWHLELLSYRAMINAQIDKSQLDDDLATRSLLLYGYHGLTKADPTTLEQMQALFEDKASTFLPSAIQTLKKRSSLSDCMFPSDLTNPHQIAMAIAIIQYGSRYCPLLSVRSVANDLCQHYAQVPVDNENRSLISQTLALCDIGQERLKEEANAAYAKYGNLTYANYYQQFVSPLIPQKIEQIKQLANSQSGTDRVNACDPRFLPVVNFRDPDVDARVAAFEQESTKLCHSYYSSGNDEFAKLQQLRYLIERDRV